jgi:hypothetical protein
MQSGQKNFFSSDDFLNSKARQHKTMHGPETITRAQISLRNLK